MYCVFFNCAITFNMSGTHFYLTLPSNSSVGIFLDNKMTSYCVKLPQTIDLDGNWESWPALCVLSKYMVHVTGWVRHTYFYADKSGVFQQAIIDYGYYQSMQDLVKAG